LAPTQAVAVAPLPFIAAAHEHQEPAFDVSIVPLATSQQVLQGAQQALPAEGFLRAVWILVTTSGGTIGSAALAADAPWNLIQSITLSDVNGAPIFGPVSGFDTFLCNKWGGYMFRPDPLAAPDANGTGAITFAFALRIPVEINRQTGFGSLANQNAAASYRLSAVLNTIANIWSVAPTLAPTVRIRGWVETWTQPLPFDAMRRPQETQPPAHGTTQYWSKSSFAVNAGQQSVTLTRVGNLIRALILVYRTAAGVRITQASGNMPDPIELDWDARMLRTEPLYYRREFMAQSVPASGAAAGGGAAGVVEDGVLVYNFDRSLLGHAGGGSTAMYLPTVQSSRLQVTANFPVAGTIDVLTNDVAPVEVNPALRYAEGSATGFHPQVGTPIYGSGS
jgi:hypothetical protein